MNLSQSQVGLACRIFLQLAYPGGPDTIPSKKKTYIDLPQDRPLADFLPPAPCALEVCQLIPGPDSEPRGVALRLGSSHFPHLKLKVQLVEHNGATAEVYAVDTHDAFSKTSAFPPDDHPDAEAWLILQRKNRELKEKIELAWQQVGLTTFNSLLRSDLTGAAP